MINFTPHLVPMNRGILATEYAKLTKDVTWEEVKAVYDKYYANEKFVRVLEKDVYPETKWVEGSNYVDIGFKIDPRTNRIIMMGAIDNLVKGAAGQAVQNLSLIHIYWRKLYPCGERKTRNRRRRSAGGSAFLLQRALF